MHSVMGMTMKEISQVLQPELQGSNREQIFDECCRYEVEYLYDHPGVLYPYLRETLEELRADGYTLTIVSNCQRGYVESFLHGSGLGELFADYEEWERTGLSKGENIRKSRASGRRDRSVFRAAGPAAAHGLQKTRIVQRMH